MRKDAMEEHIMKLNGEMGVVQSRCNDLWKLMSLCLTLQAGTFILILTHILKIV